MYNWKKRLLAAVLAGCMTVGLMAPALATVGGEDTLTTAGEVDPGFSVDPVYPVEPTDPVEPVEPTPPVETEIPDGEIPGGVLPPEEVGALTASETYDGVTVDVSAPAGAFPEGTTVTITPIKEELDFGEKAWNFVEKLFGFMEENYDNEELEPMDVVRYVMDETVATFEENEPLVAFDISFYDVDGVKVQPEGDTVSVSFTVDQSSSLLDGSETQLQVYHLDESGEEPVAEPVGEAVTVEAGQDAELSVEADQFSIYVVGPSAPATTTYTFYVNDQEYAKQIVKTGETLLEPEAPVSEDEGTVFDGWYTQDGEEFTGFGEVGTIEESSTVNLYARFDTAYYVFYMDGTDVDSRVIYTEKVAGDRVLQLNPDFPAIETEAGTANTGWSEEPDGDVVSELYINDQDHTLYPVIKSGYWLRFDSQGGTSVDSQFVISGETTAEPIAPTRYGYQFDGWYTEAEGGTKYNFGQSLTADTKLYAHWISTRVTYTVIYWKENANDDEYSFYKSEEKSGMAGETTEVRAESLQGFQSPAVEQKVIDGNGTTIVNVRYQREVYTIKFWRAEFNGWGIFGRWEKGTEYTEKRITAKYEQNIRSQWPKNKVGTTQWYVDLNSSTSQLNIDIMPLGGDEFYDKAGSSGDDIATYYVEILPGEKYDTTAGGKYYKISHQDVADGGTVTEEDRYPITGFTLNKNLSTRPGSNYRGSKFYYDRNEYKINYYNGGSVDKSQTYQYQADISGAGIYEPNRPSNIPEEYTFAGWYKDPQGTELYDFNGKTMPANDIIVYAKWAPVTYTVEFDLNGALGNIDSQTLQPGEKVEKPADPVRDGYQFGGWLTQDGEPYDFEQGVTHDMTLVAQWISEGYYTVTYTSGEGAGTPPSDLTKYAGGAHAQVAAPTTLTPPEKKVFLGWKVKAGEKDTGLTVQPGDWIEVTDNMVLVAQWGEKPEETQVIYKLEGGNYDGKTDDVVVTTHNNGQLIVMEAPKKPGYEFTGWLIQGTETIVQPGATIQVDNTNPDGNVLIAQWEANSINITIEKVVYETPVQSFIFKITGANNFEMAVVMNPEDFEGALSHTVTICDLPAGNYTVTEDTKWSWKYTVNVTSQGISETGTVTFTNTRNDENWLGGSDSAENHFDPVSSGSSDQTIDTLDALVPPLPTGEKKQGDGDDQKKSEPEFDGDPELDDGTQEGGVNHV